VAEGSADTDTDLRDTAGPPAGDDGNPAVTVTPAGSPAVRLGLAVSVAVPMVAVIAWVLTADRGPTAWDATLHQAGLDHRSAGLTAVAIALSVTSEYVAYVIAPLGTLLLLRPRPWWFGAVAGVLMLAAGQGVRVALAA
jgi:hypothetical protein